MKHIDAEAIRTESCRGRFTNSLIAVAYITGLFIFGTIGFLVGREMTDENRIIILSSIGFFILYVVGVSMLGRMLRRRC